MQKDNDNNLLPGDGEQAQPVFQLGQVVKYTPKDGEYPEPYVTMVVGSITGQDKYCIPFPHGASLGQIKAKHESVEMMEMDDSDYAKMHVIAEASELSPPDFDSPEFAQLPFIDRLYAAVHYSNEAYIGKLFLTGELAPISRADYETLQNEYHAIIDLLHIVNASVAPLFDPQGMAIIQEFVLVDEDNKPKIQIMKAAKDYALGMVNPGRSKIKTLFGKVDRSVYQHVDSPTLLAICRKHGLILDSALDLFRLLGLIKTQSPLLGLQPDNQQPPTQE